MCHKAMGTFKGELKCGGRKIFNFRNTLFSENIVRLLNSGESVYVYITNQECHIVYARQDSCYTLICFNMNDYGLKLKR